MKNKQWGITLMALVVGLLLLAGGFSIYARKSLDKSSVQAPDKSRVVKVEAKKNGTSFLVSEYDKNGQREDLSEWQGRLLTVEWTKDSSKYIINQEDQGCKKIEIKESKSAKVAVLNEEVREDLFEFLEKKHGKEIFKDAVISLEFQSWCDDNKAMFVKYEVDEAGTPAYSGYMIWNTADNSMAAVYEIN